MHETLKNQCTSIQEIARKHVMFICRDCSLATAKKSAIFFHLSVNEEYFSWTLEMPRLKEMEKYGPKDVRFKED